MLKIAILQGVRSKSSKELAPSASRAPERMDFSGRPPLPTKGSGSTAEDIRHNADHGKRACYSVQGRRGCSIAPPGTRVASLPHTGTQLWHYHDRLRNSTL